MIADKKNLSSVEKRFLSLLDSDDPEALHLTEEEIDELAALDEQSPDYADLMEHIAQCKGDCPRRLENSKRLYRIFLEELEQSNEEMRPGFVPVRQKWVDAWISFWRPVTIGLVTAGVSYLLLNVGGGRFFSRSDGQLAQETPTPRPTGPTDTQNALRITELEKNNEELKALASNRQKAIEKSEAENARLKQERDKALLAAQKPPASPTPAAPVTTPLSADAVWERAYAMTPLALPDLAALAMLSGVTRNGESTAPPISLQSPAGSNVLTARPIFVWEARPGAASYSVEVQDDETSEKIAVGENIKSAGDARVAKWASSKELPADRAYRWSVTAKNGEGEVIAESKPGVFRTLPPGQQAAGTAFVAKNAGQHFALAVLYAQYGVWSDAMRELDLYAKSHPNSPAVKDLRQKIAAAQRRALTATAQ